MPHRYQRFYHLNARFNCPVQMVEWPVKYWGHKGNPCYHFSYKFSWCDLISCIVIMPLLFLFDIRHVCFWDGTIQCFIFLCQQYKGDRSRALIRTLPLIQKGWISFEQYSENVIDSYLRIKGNNSYQNHFYISPFNNGR